MYTIAYSCEIISSFFFCSVVRSGVLCNVFYLKYQKDMVMDAYRHYHKHYNRLYDRPCQTRNAHNGAVCYYRQLLFFLSVSFFLLLSFNVHIDRSDVKIMFTIAQFHRNVFVSIHSGILTSVFHTDHRIKMCYNLFAFLFCSPYFSRQVIYEPRYTRPYHT